MSYPEDAARRDAASEPSATQNSPKGETRSPKNLSLSSQSTAEIFVPPAAALYVHCVHCNHRNPLDGVLCLKCGKPQLWPTRSSPDRVFQSGDELSGFCIIIEQLDESDGIETYLAQTPEGEGRFYLIRVAKRLPVLDAAMSSGDTTVGTTTPPAEGRAIRSLRMEREAFGDNHASALPRLLQHVETDDYYALIVTLATGTPLLQAWRGNAHPLSRKFAWLEQLRQAFLHLHQRNAIFAGITLDRLLIDSEGQLQIRDVGSLAPAPSRGFERETINCYSAPELSNPNRIVDGRSDAYSFGAIVCALHLGRELDAGDFENGRFMPLMSLLPDAAPPLFRLLSKTLAFHPEHRFPSHAKLSKDPGGIGEIGEAIAEYARAVNASRFQISGWSNTGLTREHNEDAFTVSHLTTGALDFRRDVALVCVADGMGGHAAGEVASAVAVSTVAEFLRSRGLSSAMTQQFGKNHPFYDLRRCADLLDEAVAEANATVKTMADADNDRTAMGCTLEVVLLIDRHAIVSHVGDGRVYVVSGTDVEQITQDQTLVNRLVEIGRLTPEQAAVHPRRGELSQAVGVHSQVAPSRYFVDLSDGDWLIVCTDGLSNHVSPQTIGEIVRNANSSETAARRLINQANAGGGGDNATAVVVRVV